MKNTLKYICEVCMFINIYLGLWNLMIGAAWYIVMLNFMFAILCWYSYDNA